MLWAQDWSAPFNVIQQESETCPLKQRDKMKAKPFTDEQIVAVLQEAAKGEKPVTALCREKGILEATFYAWRKKFGGMQVTGM